MTSRSRWWCTPLRMSLPGAATCTVCDSTWTRRHRGVREGAQLEVEPPLPAFLEHAMRVLKPEGLLQAKITGIMHSRRNPVGSRGLHDDGAAAVGFAVCAM